VQQRTTAHDRSAAQGIELGCRACKRAVAGSSVTFGRSGGSGAASGAHQAVVAACALPHHLCCCLTWSGVRCLTVRQRGPRALFEAERGACAGPAACLLLVLHKRPSGVHISGAVPAA
jgi:hypothetical protein